MEKRIAKYSLNNGKGLSEPSTFNERVARVMHYSNYIVRASRSDKVRLAHFT